MQVLFYINEILVVPKAHLFVWGSARGFSNPPAGHRLWSSITHCIEQPVGKKYKHPFVLWTSLCGWFERGTKQDYHMYKKYFSVVFIIQLTTVFFFRLSRFLCRNRFASFLEKIQLLLYRRVIDSEILQESTTRITFIISVTPAQRKGETSQSEIHFYKYKKVWWNVGGVIEISLQLYFPYCCSLFSSKDHVLGWNPGKDDIQMYPKLWFKFSCCSPHFEIFSKFVQIWQNLQISTRSKIFQTWQTGPEFSWKKPI